LAATAAAAYRASILHAGTDPQAYLARQCAAVPLFMPLAINWNLTADRQAAWSAKTSSAAWPARHARLTCSGRPAS
jgi:hypothetical protein